MSLVSTDWLEENHKNVKILDASWHMPNINRNAYKEYEGCHIPNSIFFDLDKSSDLNSDLPHMLSSSDIWTSIAAAWQAELEKKVTEALADPS